MVFGKRRNPPPPPPEAKIRAMYRSTSHPEWYALFLCTKDKTDETPIMLKGSERWEEVPMT